MLSINHLFFGFPKKPLFKDLCLSLATGEIVSLLGPSGSGKTTLFRLITGLLLPDRGEIQVNGKDSSISYMGQDDLLLPWYTLEENLLLFAKMAKSPVSPSHINGLLNLVGLKGSGAQYPSKLSKGMRQRGSLARALLLDRPLLLLDEPFSNLDAKIKIELQELLLHLQKRKKLSIFFITHDFNDAAILSDRILLLKDQTIAKEWRVKEHEQQALINSLKTSL